LANVVGNLLKWRQVAEGDLGNMNEGCAGAASDDLRAPSVHPEGSIADSGVVDAAGADESEIGRVDLTCLDQLVKSLPGLDRGGDVFGNLSRWYAGAFVEDMNPDVARLVLGLTRRGFGRDLLVRDRVRIGQYPRRKL